MAKKKSSEKTAEKAENKELKEEEIKEEKEVKEEKETKEETKEEKLQKELDEKIRTKLEKELADITDELFGDAATDYIRAGELDDRRMTVEDRLMQLYEEEESFSVAEDMDE